MSIVICPEFTGDTVGTPTFSFPSIIKPPPIPHVHFHIRQVEQSCYFCTSTRKCNYIPYPYLKNRENRFSPPEFPSAEDSPASAYWAEPGSRRFLSRGPGALTRFPEYLPASHRTFLLPAPRPLPAWSQNHSDSQIPYPWNTAQWPESVPADSGGQCR